MIENQTVFVDTNILVYSKVKSNPFYLTSFTKLYELFNSNQLYISRQVIREYLNVMTKPDNLKYPISLKDLVQDIEYFSENFIILNEDHETTTNLLNLITKYNVKGRQIHDANIVATMLANNIKNLFTHNVKDFDRFNNLINIIELG